MLLVRQDNVNVPYASRHRDVHMCLLYNVGDITGHSLARWFAAFYVTTSNALKISMHGVKIRKLWGLLDTQINT